jgi:hypothetical protein
MEGETIQWPKDTKGEIRNWKWKEGQNNDQKILKLYSEAFHLQLLITPLVSVGHCIVSPSIYSFWLHLWYLLVIVLSLLPFTASDYTSGIFWSLYCLSFHLQLLITPLVSFGHCIVSPSIYSFWLHLWYLLVIVLSLLPFTASDYPLVSFGHCIVPPLGGTIQWPKDTKAVFRSCKWKERQYNDQKIPKV